MTSPVTEEMMGRTVKHSVATVELSVMVMHIASALVGLVYAPDVA